MEIVYNAAHPDRLLMLGASSYNWISTDFGKTFSKVRPRSLSSCPVVLHPRVYSVCQEQQGRNCLSRSSSLFRTSACSEETPLLCALGGDAGPDAGILAGV